MKMYMTKVVVFSLAVIILTGCKTTRQPSTGWQFDMKELASSQRQWTGVAVSQEGRIFVNFPRWSPDVPVSVGELTPQGLKPYPDQEWNNWDPTMSPADHFVCVQSVYIDRRNNLWILDPASPNMAGVLEGGPKLIRVDLTTNRIMQKIVFDDSIAPKASYLNDVRVDADRNFAYITDSGTGAIIVVNLDNEKAKRVLANHPSTKSEEINIVVEKKLWTRDGKVPQISVDGIALDPANEYLYYHALSGNNLYRINTEYLRNAFTSDADPGRNVEFLKKTGPCDGMIFGADNELYLTAIERSAIIRFTTDRKIQVVKQDKNLKWPDSFGLGPDGSLYVTTSQIHLGPNPPTPYKLYKLTPIREKK